jgi:hypothetical protein
LPDFTIPIDFNSMSMNVFHHQLKNNAVYAEYIKLLNIPVDKIKYPEEIPFLPIRFFKSHQVITNGNTQNAAVFTSSGTTSAEASKHYVGDLSLYEQSFLAGFTSFYGKVTDYCFLCLLPSYLEREGSSLIYMCKRLIEESKNPLSGFYLNDFEKLHASIKRTENQNQKTILLGVTYALLDFAEKYPLKLNCTIVMETGGMKGKRRELAKPEVHERLKNAFCVAHIHSEYGMTELLSQAYSHGNGIYKCPPWMRVYVRETNDPLRLSLKEKTGGINVIDLANVNSCSFIATQDLGRRFEDGTFEISGRFDDAEIRGCNLMIE